MTTSYTPLQGTIPARAIAHLKTLPAGTKMATGALCDALGQGDANAFRTCMQKAIAAGLVKAQKQPGQLTLYWSLGDGKQAPPPSHEPEDDEPPRPARPSAWAFPPRTVFDLPAAMPDASSQVEKPEVEDLPAPSAPKPANCLGWTPAPPAAGPVDPVGAEEMADAVAASVPAARAASPLAPPDLEQREGLTASELFQRLPQEAEPIAYCMNTAAVEAAMLAWVTQSPEPNDEPEPFVCAPWSDGRLQLQRGDTELALLDLDETKALLAYLKWTGALDTVAKVGS